MWTWRRSVSIFSWYRFNWMVIESWNVCAFSWTDCIARDVWVVFAQRCSTDTNGADMRLFESSNTVSVTL
jgi:hypothetical protein